MALPAPSPVTTITLHLAAQSSVCPAASVLREWWTIMENALPPQSVLVCYLHWYVIYIGM